MSWKTAAAVLPCLGDLNDDGLINSADLNGDGVVDSTDLGLMLGLWGPCR